MSDDNKTPTKTDAKSERQARLNEALRANLQKRKQQSRKRTAVQGDDAAKQGVDSGKG